MARCKAAAAVAGAGQDLDGNHVRVDGFVSLGVVSAVVVALVAEIGDPIIRLLITLVILKITWDSGRTVRQSHGALGLGLQRDTRDCG